MRNPGARVHGQTGDLTTGKASLKMKSFFGP